VLKRDLPLILQIFRALLIFHEKFGILSQYLGKIFASFGLKDRIRNTDPDPEQTQTKNKSLDPEPAKSYGSRRIQNMVTFLCG
jgi:hypothetical protein